MSAKIVSSGSINEQRDEPRHDQHAHRREAQRFSASICSVTTIEPSSAEIAAPARPATTTAESIGPSSRNDLNATAPPTRFPTP